MHSRKRSSSSHSSSPSSHGSFSSFSRPNLSISLPASAAVSPNERSIISMEKEIMRLQEVLKEREAEISALENSLKETTEENLPSKEVSHAHTNGHANSVADGAIASLSPRIINQFDHIRKSMEINGNGHTNDAHETGSEKVSEPDESLERLNELMLYVSFFSSIFAVQCRSAGPWPRKNRLIRRLWIL